MYAILGTTFAGAVGTIVIVSQIIIVSDLGCNQKGSHYYDRVAINACLSQCGFTKIDFRRNRKPNKP